MKEYRGCLDQSQTALRASCFALPCFLAAQWLKGPRNKQTFLTVIQFDRNSNSSMHQKEIILKMYLPM
jgi:hypothetical protein